MKKATDKKRSVPRLVARWTLRLAAVAVLLVVLLLAVLFRGPLYHRFYLYPKQAQAWERVRAQRVPTNADLGEWHEYRGVMHSHSELSHDCSVTFPEIVTALKKADVSFIFMSDHCNEGKADYSAGWKGVHDGILFVRGFEMDYGFMPWGLPDDTVLDKGEEAHALARRIASLGGTLCFAHPEEERIWDLPELTGMEIYNLHTNFKAAKVKEIVPDILFSAYAYPEQVIRSIFVPLNDAIVRWDTLNRTRRVTAIGGNDCHRNSGFRGFYTAKDTFQITTTGKRDDIVKEFKLNAFTKLLLRAALGPLQTDQPLFRFEIDKYERLASFVNTHFYAKECTEPALLDALRQSRGFVAFDMLADARGFLFTAQGREARAMVGEAIPLEPELKLRVVSPLPCRVLLFHDGLKADEQIGTSLEFSVSAPGKYRVEADLDLRLAGDKQPLWTPWVYANPIEVTARP